MKPSQGILHPLGNEPHTFPFPEFFQASVFPGADGPPPEKALGCSHHAGELSSQHSVLRAILSKKPGLI